MKTPPARRYPRTARVNEVLREIIAEELERLISDDEAVRLITITGVEAEPDLRKAVVFYSSLNEDAGDFLEESRTALQKRIAREVRMKRTPQLSFKIDPAIVSGYRIEEIIGRMHRDD